MALQREQERSAAELVSLLLRALMLGHRLWGVRSQWIVAELPALLRTSDDRVCDLLTSLAGEGLVMWDEAAGTVRLTRLGVRSLQRAAADAESPELLYSPIAVVFRSTKWH